MGVSGIAFPGAHETTNERLALKLIRNPVRADQEEAFRREVSLLFGSDHPVRSEASGKLESDLNVDRSLTIVRN
jgi:hypothetical protein